ncbi:FAD dependent oxidoreductase [Oleiphilus messinensis]|uniref:FAD dependent oxidoreductase n=1 Tax=Oleiphilus messinensis TaxID=141451 RepID=A0A1Y0IDB4_9GAMM|nr:glycerol-3-phosphate dehydrogenase/oxidase [Oleiphilus messinensis]ARU57756.1 FAD dependent oxidoreductase [Oleiphilus messinensis]
MTESRPIHDGVQPDKSVVCRADRLTGLLTPTAELLDQPVWDLVIIGGGITGAGVFQEASRQGLKVLLVEKFDFAWGTSSKSSKMVHGGLRYLGSGQFKLTRESVQERQRLLSELRGLVNPLPFLMSHFRRTFPGPVVFNLLLTVYDFFAGRRNHRFHRPVQAGFLASGVSESGLRGLTEFGDAVVDDARLVFRVLSDQANEHAVAFNYLSLESVHRVDQLHCVRLKNQATELGGPDEGYVFSKAVVNATGAWTDQLREQVTQETAIRPLRGSHLVFPFWRLPVAYSISFFHPEDKRPVFVFPWEGVTVAGTTDLDHELRPGQDISISEKEVDYLLKAINHQFPGRAIQECDAIASYSGVRPVVSSGALNPSKEKREHSIWDDAGVISVAGGKLTTFRLIALDVLAAAAPYLGLSPEVFQPNAVPVNTSADISQEVSWPVTLPASIRARLQGRFGGALPRFLAEFGSAHQLANVHNTDTLWAELSWAARYENVVNLDDLLLRRTRLGLLLKLGGAEIMDSIREICQWELKWNDTQWRVQQQRYYRLWRDFYCPPGQRANFDKAILNSALPGAE